MDDKIYVELDDIDELMINLAWLEALAVCLIVIGFTAMYAPFYSSFSIENIVGGSYLVAGGMFVAHGFGSRKWGWFEAELILGGLYLLCAVLLLTHPYGVRIALTVYLAVFFLLRGILKLVYAPRLRVHGDRQWLLAGAAVSLLMGIVVGLGLTGDVAWMIGVLMGMDLVFSGLAAITVCRSARRSLGVGMPFCFGETCFTR